MGNNRYFAVERKEKGDELYYDYETEKEALDTLTAISQEWL